MRHIRLGPCCKLHLNLSQDQERRLERELAEERERKRGGGGEEEQRLRGLLNEAEVRETRQCKMKVDVEMGCENEKSYSYFTHRIRGAPHLKGYF